MGLELVKNVHNLPPNRGGTIFPQEAKQNPQMPGSWESVSREQALMAPSLEERADYPLRPSAQLRLLLPHSLIWARVEKKCYRTRTTNQPTKQGKPFQQSEKEAFKYKLLLEGQKLWSSLSLHSHPFPTTSTNALSVWVKVHSPPTLP